VITEHFKIAIIGSGPSGLSAAAHAAELGISHILLEAEQHPANTITKYQKGKLVMAEPNALPLRSPMSFAVGTREKVLETWIDELQQYHVNLRLGAQVASITGGLGAFSITLASGQALKAEYIVLAIGLQGNIRKLGVSGEDLPGVQYQLDDPDEFEDETIVVVGGGDTGIENALALMKKNQVILINRQEGFINCKERNYTQLKAALKQGEIECRLDTGVENVELAENEQFPLKFVARTQQGIERIGCHRVIARLGADPPRQLLESFGVRFPSDDPASVPQLSASYESNVPGLYIVGALAGYPLIKQAMNQGYEAVDHILGRPVEPADEILLREKFSRCQELGTVAESLAKIRQNVPLLSPLSNLQLRDFLLESNVLAPREGEIVFRRNDYSTTFFCIVAGSVEACIHDDAKPNFKLKAGDFFGDMALISGRRRAGTIRAGKDCLLIETPRHYMLKLIDSLESVRRMIDEVALKRAVRVYIGLSLSESDLNYLVHDAKVRHYAAGDVLFYEGAKPDGLYLIQRGSVTISRMIGGKEVVLSYVSAGNYVGEMALVSGQPRFGTVRAAVSIEAIHLNCDRVAEVMARNPDIRNEMHERYLTHMQDEHIGATLQSGNDAGNLISFLVRQGIGEATDVLLIDESLCTRCNNCEKACADTHDGTSRLDRKSGPTFDQIRVPSSCRHCEHPHCMKDCPPDAIRRSVNGEVFINDTCIGCGNCVANCPYDVIQLASIEVHRKRPSLWQWLILGVGTEPGTKGDLSDKATTKLAVKCDMCKDLAAGPACVRSCPTGAAIRVGPEEFLDYAVWHNNKIA
jgi:thioredoxin reductase/CRP-like cAMP-binding protein/Fe-S-cluster-containing hydrogenase component 2